ncbi:MAG: coniferyl-alcohol dehydrogenase [Pseudomonadales bacterium]|nr:coniferyl-alcohol dehydrogenase [Pseudomonadales bacterium]
MDFLGYRNKRVIVSGCFSGMGEATARQLLALGAQVHGIDYKETGLELASFNQVDLRDPAAIDAAIAKIGGKVDALFNCAGLPQTAPALDVMKVNYAGTRRVTERVLPLMSAGGAIASISSTGGLGWSRRMPVLMQLLSIDDYEAALRWCEEHPDDVKEGYTLSKEAIIVWTMLFSQRLVKQGIRINCTLPSPTQTPMMSHFESATPAAVIDTFTLPTGRRSTPEEQAGALILLNSAAAGFVNGVVLPVDGGFMGGLTTGQIDLGKIMSR